MTLLYSQANITREQLQQVPTPAPMGRFHQPYPFHEFIDDVYEGLDRNNLSVLDSEFEISKDGMKLFGAMEVSIDTITGDFRQIIGVRGSHDQTIPRALVAGTQVMVCSNLCFSGDLSRFNTKQTLNMRSRLPALIDNAVKRIPEEAAKQEEVFQSYKDYEFSKPQDGYQLLVAAYKANGLSAAQLGTAINEYDQPTYSEHTEFGYSAWRAFNAATQAVKPTGQQVNHNLIAKRTGIINSVCREVVTS